MDLNELIKKSIDLKKEHGGDVEVEINAQCVTCEEEDAICGGVNIHYNDERKTIVIYG